MKRLQLQFVIPFLLFPFLHAFSQESGSLQVNVKACRNDLGNVTIAVHNGPEGFPGGEENLLVAKKAVIKQGIATATFEELPFGEYAISVFHDENENDEVDTNWIGIPKEGVGASNNAKGRMGPPKYEDAKFDFEKDGQKVSFDMHYY